MIKYGESRGCAINKAYLITVLPFVVSVWRFCEFPSPFSLFFCERLRLIFKHDDFDEDAFISDRLKMGISLHTLHDSLLQYFNILKNSLVELINRDYADFVNLSTNLVGLDKIIKNLEEPLIDVRQRVSVFELSLNLLFCRMRFQRSGRRNESLNSTSKNGRSCGTKRYRLSFFVVNLKNFVLYLKTK
ncbi:unnamed protein product [Rodentolepis nana]|uniref:Conserved oligomeric Golgi complex subunit 2 n=1 Tax=Rodentolepis nana TaxID=102285 RepID=A0A3P7SJ46_RODNA|nr:unnamed protein product [Rodentolepis nana]